MKTIYKYELNDDFFGEYQIVSMPQYSEILTAQLQYGKIVLWALVDLERMLEGRAILIYGTGFEVYETNLQFIATVQNGGDVLHVFERL